MLLDKEKIEKRVAMCNADYSNSDLNFLNDKYVRVTYVIDFFTYFFFVI